MRRFMGYIALAYIATLIAAFYQGMNFIATALNAASVPMAVAWSMLGTSAMFVSGYGLYEMYRAVKAVKAPVVSR